MIDADKVIARLREKEAEHRRTNRLPYADEYGEAADLIEMFRKAAIDLLEFRVGDLPAQGWLQDNSGSRAALGRLAELTGDTK